jgi:hypothetical protein
VSSVGCTRSTSPGCPPSFITSRAERVTACRRGLSGLSEFLGRRRRFVGWVRSHFRQRSAGAAYRSGLGRPCARAPSSSRTVSSRPSPTVGIVNDAAPVTGADRLSASASGAGRVVDSSRVTAVRCSPGGIQRTATRPDAHAVARQGGWNGDVRRPARAVECGIRDVTKAPATGCVNPGVVERAANGRKGRAKEDRRHHDVDVALSCQNRGTVGAKNWSDPDRNWLWQRETGLEPATSTLGRLDSESEYKQA